MFGLLVNLLRTAGQAVAGAWGAAAALAAPVAAVATSGVVGTAVTVGAVVAATATVGYGVYYVTTGQPIVFVPGVPDAPIVGKALKALPPSYVFAIPNVRQPGGIALAPDGRQVYVTESGDERRVRIFDPQGKELGSLAAPPGHQYQPVNIAVGGDGTVYVTDLARRSIESYRPDGAYRGPFRPAGATGMVGLPVGISLGKKGALYVTDVTTGAHRVMAFEGDRLRQAFGREGSGEGQFSYPNAVVVDEDRGAVFVSDGNNARVLIFDTEGELKGRISGGGGEPLSLPRGLALDAVGRLYVVDTLGHKVLVYDTRQDPVQFLFAFGESGRGDGQLAFPNAVAVDSGTGRVYVTDRVNNRVSVWAY